MTECGICGSGNRPLYCGSCATNLTLRTRINILNVNAQLSSLQQTVVNTFQGLTPESDTTDKIDRNVENSGNKAYIAELTTKAEHLHRKLKLINEKVAEKKLETKEINKKTQLILKETKKVKLQNAELDKNSGMQFGQYMEMKQVKENELERSYKDMLHLTLTLQSKNCKELLEIFSLKKKRKKVGYEIVLGFNIIPDITQLGHYSITTINSGLERVCHFILLLASYLGIRLPYDIIPPRQSQPYVLIGPTQETLVLHYSVKTMMRSSTKEFHHYCLLLGMLVINVSYLAVKLGISFISDVKDVAKMHHVLAQIYLRLDGIIKEGHQIKIYSGYVPADLESVQDHLITAIDVDMHGKSAEWNIIEGPDELPSEINEIRNNKSK